MDKLLEQIDAIKQKLTDQEYRDMMDSLKVIHDEEEVLKYELVIAVIENLNEDCHKSIPRYRICKRKMIPKEFKGENNITIRRLIEKTKEGGGILDLLRSIHIYERQGIVELMEGDADDYNISYIRYDKNNEYNDDDNDLILAEYTKWTLLAVNEL